MSRDPTPTKVFGLRYDLVELSYCTDTAPVFAGLPAIAAPPVS
jgi:hypothetical protein